MSKWIPQLGPQADAIGADWCTELFYGGARGGGKTHFLLGDWLKDVDRYGSDWQGVIFRQTYPALDEVYKEGKKLFLPSGAVFKESKDKYWFEWPNGAILRLRALEKDVDAEKYQGQQFSYIAFDELPQWPTSVPYDRLLACLRGGDVPTRRIRATGNPGGRGHNWVKERFIDPGPYKTVVHKFVSEITGEETETTQLFIPSSLSDNRELLRTNPHYEAQLRRVGSKALVDAWLRGDWSVIQGAYFDTWSAEHIISPFHVPEYWPRYMSYDHGYSHPFSVGWWAVSDGSEVIAVDGRTYSYPKGSLIRYREWYGCSGRADEGLKLTPEQIASGILSRESGERGIMRVGDPAIVATQGGPSIQEKMAMAGVSIRGADNSRITGWTELRERLRSDETRKPLLYVFTTCENMIRLMPLAQHCPNNPEDLDTKMEDHLFDEVRYMCMSRPIAGDAPVVRNTGPEPLTLNRLIKENGLWTSLKSRRKKI